MRRPWVAALALVLGCGEPSRMDRFMPGSVRTVLEAPDSVQVIRIDSALPHPRSSEKATSEEIYSRFPEVAQATVQGDLRAQLLRLLLDPASYNFDAKGCIPDPGAKIRIARGSSVVVFFFCFHCREVLRSGPDGGYQNDHWAEFDPSEPALRKIVQSLFPNDEGIQELK